MLKIIKNTLQSKLLDHPQVRKGWAQFRGRRQEKEIREELKEYRRRAAMRGLSWELSEERLRNWLERRLRNRGRQAKKKGELEILYLTPLSNWELHNIPPELEKLGRVRSYYVSETDFEPNGEDWLQCRKAFEADLLEFVQSAHDERPVDVVVSYLSGWFVGPKTIDAMNELGCVTCAFWLDSRHRFSGRLAGGRYSGARSVARAYDLNLVSTPDAIIKYLVEGGVATFWPEGANPEHFCPRETDFKYDVSFIGAKYGLRPLYIDYLRSHGINVETFGPGWLNGPVPAEEMPQIYARSRINLGFAGIGYSMEEMCLKGRDFEVPMCGGLYLTNEHDTLHRVWDVGEEIMTYTNKKDCLYTVRQLLEEPEQCTKIRRAARRRGLREHTWERRFERAFELLGVLEPLEES